MGLGDRLKALGKDALAKGQALAEQGIKTAEDLAQQGIATATAAGEKLALKAQFGLALDRLAAQDNTVSAELVEIHRNALTDPVYVEKFNAYAASLTAPKTAPQKHESGDKIRDTLDNGVSAVESAVTEGAAKLKAQKGLVDLAIK